MRELRGEPRSLTVDVVGPGLTPAVVLAAARRRAPDLEFFARFHTGTEAALPLLLADRLDVTFGRNPGSAAGVRQRAVRREPIAVLLPERHPLAELAAVPLESLRGTGLCVRAGNHATPGWEHAVLQLLAPFGADPTKAHPHVHGAGRRAAAAGGAGRPVPWALIWRDGVDHPGLRALHEAVDELAATEGWGEAAPAGAWLPQPEASGQPV